MRSLFAVFALLLLSVPAFADDAVSLRHDWAVLKYQTPDKEAQISGLQALADRAAALAAASPADAEPVLWQAAALSTKASVINGISALGDVKKARDLALQADKMAPGLDDGYAAVILAALYHQVPGWPVAFGDNKKAEKYFARALAVNPNGLDVNYYYGEYLMDRGEKARARAALEQALAAPARPGYEIADAGRKAEVQKLLKELVD